MRNHQAWKSTARWSCWAFALGACTAAPTTSSEESSLAAINVAEQWVSGWYASDTGQRGVNEYVHDDLVYWNDANPEAPGKFTNHSDCSGFIDATMKKAYGYDSTSLDAWLCTTTAECPAGRALALAYFDAVMNESHFAIIPKATQLAVGDLIAIKYDSDPSNNTGHVVWVDSQVSSDGTTQDLNGTTIYLWRVDVIDSSSSYHGSADLRNTIGDGEGVGRGTMHLITYADGDLAGYKWSTWSGSEQFINGDGKGHTIIGGRYDQTTAGGGTSGVGAVVTSAQYDAMFPPSTRAAGYTYASFLSAAAAYPTFAQTGDSTMRARELAAFFANVAHETSQLEYLDEGSSDPYCDDSVISCPAASYHGRGPLQLSWNYNYHDAGAALGNDIFTNPDHVLTDPTIGWETALWFWMTSEGASYGHGPETSHAAMTGSDGFIKTIRIINGDIECDAASGSPEAAERQDRIDLYGDYVGILGTTTGAMTTSLCP